MSTGTNPPMDIMSITPASLAAGAKAPVCDVRKVLAGLSECRKVLAGLSEHEHLAVVCTLASELGLNVTQPTAEETRASASTSAPHGIEWAKEFVTQVVLSDALLGVTVQLDESKREIDDIAHRLMQVDEGDGPAFGQAGARRLVSQVKEGIFTCDSSSALVDVNAALVELLGYESKQALLAGQIFSSLFADPRVGEELRAELFERRTVRNIECKLLKRDGGGVRVFVTAMATYDSAGMPNGFQGICYKVADGACVPEHLMEAQQIEAACQMMAAYSHEITQPLVALCDAVQHLLEQCQAEGGNVESVLAISEEAAKLAEVTIKIGQIRELCTSQGATRPPATANPTDGPQPIIGPDIPTA